MRNRKILRVIAIAVISIMAFSLISQTVLATESYSISGRKFNDENNSGTDDEEPGLENWEITIESDTYSYTTTTTDSSGNYSFTGLEPGTYNVCELEEENWDQTYPNTCDGCYTVEMVDENIEDIDFGNYNGNLRDDSCDDPCGEPEPEPVVPPGGSTPQPKLTIDKSVDKEFVNPGEIITYTVIIENTGQGKAGSVVLWDELPEGFTYVNESSEGKWEIGELLKKEKRTISFEVLVSEDIEAGLYANIAKITSINFKTISDDAEVSVRVPEVKGEEIIVAVDPDPEPIIKVLPNTGTSSFAWFILGGLGILLIGILGLISIFAKQYRQLIQLSLFGILIIGSLIALVYPFIPVIKYNLPIPVVEADIEADTDEIEGNWLVIPSIGVEIPVVLGQDDSALEKGAWLLPYGSTPDLGGNTALAAHRFKYRPPHKETFYLLDKVKDGDIFYVYWEGVKYEYIVAYSKIVKPEAIEVLDQTENSIVTLITCEPLFSDKNRLIVVGELSK